MQPTAWSRLFQVSVPLKTHTYSRQHGAQQPWYQYCSNLKQANPGINTAPTSQIQTKAWGRHLRYPIHFNLKDSGKEVNAPETLHESFSFFEGTEFEVNQQLFLKTHIISKNLH